MSQPNDDIRQKLAQLREEFAQKSAALDQQKKVIENTETTANSPLNKAKGGIIKSASSRADGIARRGKTRGTIR